MDPALFFTASTQAPGGANSLSPDAASRPGGGTLPARTCIRSMARASGWNRRTRERNIASNPPIDAKSTASPSGEANDAAVRPGSEL